MFGCLTQVCVDSTRWIRFPMGPGRWLPWMWSYDVWLPVVPARGGAENASGIYYTFFIYRTCMRRAPARSVCARCVRVCCTALLQSRNMTCVRPRCNATPSKDSPHTSQFRLNILHFTSHTSSHLKLHFGHFSNFLHTANLYTEKLLHRSRKL